jgi:hypothetical protein
MIAEGVYLLCAALSIAAATLLFKGFRRNQMPLLFWSGLCFVGLALNNVLLLVDLVIIPDVDLSVLRTATALAAVSVLLFGLIREAS